MMARLLLTFAVASLTVLAAVESLPASAVERTAGAAVKKPKPTVSTSSTSSPSPTGSPSPTSSPSPTATPSPSPTETASTEPSPTASPQPSPTASPQPSPTASPQPTSTATSTPTTAPSTNCAPDAALLYEGDLYCPGEIAGVKAAAYGVNSRVVLNVTVTGVNGSLVYLMGGPDCWVDPSWTEPVFCGQTVAGMVVDFSGAEQLPAPSTGIELYGVTDAAGGIRPVGFITVAWCDPDYCP